MVAVVSVRLLVLEGEIDDATIARLKEVLASSLYRREIVEAQSGGRCAVGDIIAAVAVEMRLRPIDITGERRSRPIVYGRYAVTWIARKTTRKSYPQIARAMGGRDHSTILNQLRRAEALREVDPAFRRLTDRLAAEFSGEQG